MPQTKRKSPLALPKLGEWAFLIGVLLAVVFGLFPPLQLGLDTATILAVLVLLGIVVGLLNVTAKETTGFLLAALTLIVSGAVSFTALPYVGRQLSDILAYIAFLVAPAAVIVALKTVFALAKDA